MSAHQKNRIDGIFLSPSRNIAGNIYKFAFRMTFGADIRGSSAYHSKTTHPAVPVSHAALGANISGEPVSRGIPALCTRPYIVHIFHLFFLLFANSFAIRQIT